MPYGWGYPLEEQRPFSVSRWAMVVVWWVDGILWRRKEEQRKPLSPFSDDGDGGGAVVFAIHQIGEVTLLFPFQSGLADSTLVETACS